MSVEEPDHHCPGCGAACRAFGRYPWYFCHDCLGRAEDGAGQRLVFANAAISGGLSWALASDRDHWDDSTIGVLCLIGRRPVRVSEARFGGVVAQPIDWETAAAPNEKDARRSAITA